MKIQLLAAFVIAILASPVLAGLSVPVTRITSNSPTNIAGQLGVSVDQTNVGVQQVRFSISNGGPVSSEISEIYWQDSLGLLSNLMALPSDTSLGVGFQSEKIAPGDLPSGGNVGFSANFAVDEGKDNSQVDPGTGVLQGTMAAFKFDIALTKDYSDIENAILAGALRVGFHVRSINGGTSDSFVASAIPEPSAFALLGLVGMLSLIWKRFR